MLRKPDFVVKMWEKIMKNNVNAVNNVNKRRVDFEESIEESKSIVESKRKPKILNTCEAGGTSCSSDIQ